MRAALVLAAVACAVASPALSAAPRPALRPQLRRLALLRGGGAVAKPALPAADSSYDLLPHSRSATECLTHFGVDPQQGLSEERAAELARRYGPNALEVEAGPSALALFLGQFEDRLVQILLVVAALSYLLACLEGDAAKGWVEPMVILVILLINALVSTWQELSAADALSALQRLQPETARCLRQGGWRHDMPAAQLVPGDVIELRVGDSVPADARLLELRSTTFSTDEGSLTGESATVSKATEAVPSEARIQDKQCMVFAGTVVSNGRATAVVTATGSASEIGRIQQGVSAAKLDEEKTPLAQKLDNFGNALTLGIGAICLVVWLLSVPKFSQPAFGGWWRGALYYLKVAVALGVAAIPEGLPAVITLCLSLGTRRMAARNVVVRKLPSVETLGCTTVICTDKTGTLTTNQMTVTSLVTAVRGPTPQLREYEVEGVSYQPAGQVRGMTDDTLRGGGMCELAAGAALCNDAELKYDEADQLFTRVGEPTEAALKVLVEKLGLPGAPPPQNASAAANHFSELRCAPYAKLATLEFSRTRKSMSVLCRQRKGGRNVLFVKGAPESVLPRCSHLRLADGTTVRMSDAWRRKLKEQFSGMARRPLRCLALAVKDTQLGALAGMREDQPPSRAAAAVLQATGRFHEVERGLTFTGMVGIKDPARPEVAGAIGRCRAAGIRVIMITGDSAPTASAIARDVGVFAEAEALDGRVFVGGEFFALPEAEQSRLLTTSNMVFCRAEPADKQRLLKQLQGLGEVAAMTGDGVNDAPALQQASIGVAMGIAGTEVSKQAADMVLADDNFATIVAAVEEGRSIYSNMKAFIRYLISSNIGEVAAIFITALLGLPEGLIPLQLLWVNLVTDGPPATALGFNPPDADIMKKPPRSADDELISPWIFFRYMIVGLYVGFATVGVFVYWYVGYDWSEYSHPLVTYGQLSNWGKCTAFSELGLDQNWPPAFGQWAANGGMDLSAKPCSYLSGAGKKPASTMSLSVLVAIEMFNALNAISEDGSLLSMPPWVNPWLLLAMAVSFGLHFVILYVPFLADIFSIVPLTVNDWIVVTAFSFPVVLIDECLKAVGRARLRKELAERMAKSKGD